MILIGITWEDDQFGPMMQDITQIDYLEEFRVIQNECHYCFYLTELPYEEAVSILNEDPYGEDLSKQGLHYLHQGTDFSTFYEDEQNELKEAIKFLMKLKNTDQDKDFIDVPKRDWESLKSCNMLKFFYPFTKGESYEEDLAEYHRLCGEQNVKTNNKKVELIDLTKDQYEMLQNMGILKDAYPTATGDYEQDTSEFIETMVYLHGSKDSNYEQGKELGLTGDALNTFGYCCYEVGIKVQVNKTTGESKILGIVPDPEDE